MCHQCCMMSAGGVRLPVRLQLVDLDHANPAGLLPLQVRAAESQINQLIEKRMMRNEPMDDKLTLYRQQVQKTSRRTWSSLWRPTRLAVWSHTLSSCQVFDFSVK